MQRENVCHLISRVTKRGPTKVAHCTLCAIDGRPDGAQHASQHMLLRRQRWTIPFSARGLGMTLPRLARVMTRLNTCRRVIAC
eukprot:597664-Amphidinium_carterae.1